MSAEGSSAAARAPLWLQAAPVVFLILWSGGYAVAKIGLAHADPITFLALRYGLALAVLVPIALALRPPLPRTPVEWLHLVVVGFLIQVVYFGLSYIAFATGISAGAMALIVSLQPLVVALLAGPLLGESIGLWRWAGFALGVIGAGLVITSRAVIATGSIVGAMAAVGALAGITAATLYEKRFGLAQHPATANLVQYAVGLLGTLPIAVALEPMRVEWTPGLIGSLAYLVIGNSLIAISLLLAMIRAGEASRVSAMLFLVPPGAALIAWAMLGEEMPPVAWIGMAIAGLGVAMASWRRTPAA